MKTMPPIGSRVIIGMTDEQKRLTKIMTAYNIGDYVKPGDKFTAEVSSWHHHRDEAVFLTNYKLNDVPWDGCPWAGCWWDVKGMELHAPEPNLFEDHFL